MPQNAQAKHKAKAKEKKQTQINCSVCLETQSHFLLQKGQLDVLFMNKNMEALIGLQNVTQCKHIKACVYTMHSHMYIQAYTCTHVNTLRHVYTLAPTYTHTCVFTQTCIYTCMCTHAHAHTYAHAIRDRGMETMPFPALPQ